MSPDLQLKADHPLVHVSFTFSDKTTTTKQFRELVNELAILGELRGHARLPT